MYRIKETASLQYFLFLLYNLANHFRAPALFVRVFITVEIYSILHYLFVLNYRSNKEKYANPVHFIYYKCNELRDVYFILYYIH
jgi:hypothetical protein